jgi:hypothetical protein
MDLEEYEFVDHLLQNVVTVNAPGVGGGEE